MCLEKAQPYTRLYQQELLRLASNKKNLGKGVEKMVERCWNFLEIFMARGQKIPSVYIEMSGLHCKRR